MPDWDDPDLELSPFAPPGSGGRGGRRRAGEYDLEQMNHRKRILLENYGYLITGPAGLSHDAALSRLGINEQEWGNCVKHATIYGLALPCPRDNTLTESEEAA